MSTATGRTHWLATLLWGTVASVAIWLAGAHDVAYLGYVVAALARDPVRSCGTPA